MSTREIIQLLHKSITDKSYDFVPTVKNRNSRRKYGLTMFEIEEFLLSITECDLYKGPVKDKDIPTEEVFIFMKEIVNGVTFYVKIKKDNKDLFERIKILSCHEAGYWEA